MALNPGAGPTVRTRCRDLRHGVFEILCVRVCDDGTGSGLRNGNGNGSRGGPALMNGLQPQITSPQTSTRSDSRQ